MIRYAGALTRRFFCLVLLALLAVPAQAPAQSRTAVVLAVFGSSNQKAHDTYDAFLAATRADHPDLEVRLAHTAKTLHRPLSGDAAPGVAATPGAVLDDLAAAGFARIAVQSLHVLAGREFEELAKDVAAAGKRHPGLRVSLGAPLLSASADVLPVAKAFFESIPAERGPADAVLACVHGSSHAAAALYGELARALSSRDPLVVLAALDSEPGFDAALADIAYRAPSKAYLIPMLTVSGAHVAEDVAGPGPDSWTSRLKSAGIAPVLDDKGLADRPAFAALWRARLEAALAKLDGGR
jgi:sirohydrochlorin cobaltochelatase